MLRVTLAGVRGHLLRFLLTALAVTLGVALVAGTFVLRDSVEGTINSLLDSASRGVDVQVRGTPTDGREGAPRTPLPLELAGTLSAVPGAARAMPDIQGLALIAGADGTPVRNGGAPGFGFAYRADNPAFRLVAGKAPQGPHEIVVEKATLEKSGLKVGQTTKAVVGNDVRTVTVTGEVTFGSLFGATAILLDEPSARAVFAPDGKVSGFALSARPGVTQEELRDRVQKVLPEGAEAITGTKVAEEAQGTLETGLDLFTWFLLVFAIVAVLVGGFIIVNTFSMLVAQRTRELALLRAVGASRGQVLRVVLGEALVLGLVGSVAGIGLGLGLASLLQALARAAFGIAIDGGLPLQLRTVLVSLAVGVLVTVLSAVFPARRAARIPPVAAMRDDGPPLAAGLRRRAVIGSVLLAVGAGTVVVSVTRSSVPWALVGLGAVVAVIATLVIAPVATRPVIRLVTWPAVVTTGVVGRLARSNALRVPRRTATTASALMMGLALICGFSVIAASLKASVADIIARELTSDFVLSAGGNPVPASVAGAVARLDQVASSGAISSVSLAVGGKTTSATVSDARTLADNVHVAMVSGSVDSLATGKVLVSRSAAEEHHLSTGSRLTASVGALSGRPLTVGGVYEDNRLLDTGFVVDRALYELAVPFAERVDQVVVVRAVAGADLDRLRAALAAVARPYLVISVENGSEYIDSAASSIDQLLNLLYVLLALSVIIAVLGIVNTLALSVFERTREIGLLRAVGLRRGQLSRMIIIEAIATAVFGALLGAVVGIGLGLAAQHGMAGSGLDELAIPWLRIVVLIVAAAVAGVLAAALPAIRAVRLDVLRAITTE